MDLQPLSLFVARREQDERQGEEEAQHFDAAAEAPEDSNLAGAAGVGQGD